jgi:hypothetical protein
LNVATGVAATRFEKVVALSTDAAVDALTAVVAAVAVAAVVALVAESAVVALGTLPSVDSFTFAPVTAFAAMSVVVTALGLSFAPVTALALSCAVPTLLFGRLAAQATEPTAMIALVTVIAGSALRRSMLATRVVLLVARRDMRCSSATGPVVGVTDGSETEPIVVPWRRQGGIANPASRHPGGAVGGADELADDVCVAQAELGRSGEAVAAALDQAPRMSARGGEPGSVPVAVAPGVLVVVVVHVVLLSMEVGE